MHFQLFFPDKKNNAGACLRGVGLSDFVDGASEVPSRVGDVGGLLVGWASKIGYEPTNQRWIDSGEGYQIGFWLDEPCTPKDIRRLSMFDGFTMTLNGQEWQIPMASDLPVSFRLIGAHWTKIRKPQFDDFWRRSEIWFRRFMVLGLDEDRICEESRITPQQLNDEWCDFCVFTLRQNYRLTPLIASEMGVMDSASRMAITMSAIDGMDIQDVLQEIGRLRERDEATGSKKDEAPSIQGS